MKKFTVIIFFLFLGNVFSQKVIEREFGASEITTIEINSDVIYTINITSEKTKQIKVKAYIEGENYENVLLKTVIENNIISLNTAFLPFFEVKNDKLAAHKVIAIDMELIVPEDMEIQIKASIASVIASGNYHFFSALLETGNCTLNNFNGNAMLKTNQGFITVFAINKVEGTALSKKGIVINELHKKIENSLEYLIEAESLEGNISLFQIH